ncbi:Protein argonaute 4 -like protein [Gossypium arboreum]|uniref:Protein argonaute 4-like protein n=1 Tax=Gossypium arboreum TaxID=29729 RepID=A0A0B0M9D6_GOSAR|nr:Protein argonaute 4 -like protein [Gossypium arboreum]
MLTLRQTPSIPVVSKVPTIILGMGALFGFPEQSDVPSIAAMILSSKPVFDKVDNSIMKEALLDFYTSSEKRKPDQIIIFRDGGSPDNVLHGTVIDKKVCHPKNNDFYLGTHAGMIGITRQAHYHVLLDQTGFSADDLQEFLHSWGQFMKIRDASETSSSHGGMYAPGVISVPQLFRTAAGEIPFSWVYESRFFLQALMESRIEYL